MTMYYTDTINNQIKAVEVTRQTETSVWLEGEQYESKRRIGSYWGYFMTAADAKSWLVENQKRILARVEGQLKYAQDKLAEINAITI